jgi:predicted RNA-binding Zn-ribbon protein involved in translation (DUF1610 family)
MTAKSANCPNCGAAISFRWSAAVQTTCPYCHAILVRRDVDLEKVGRESTVPESSSPIQLGTEGRYGALVFTVIGRIVYEHDRGRWSEWYLRSLDGGSAWLSDAQGDYAVTIRAKQTDLPAAEQVRVAQSYAIDGTLFTVSSLTYAKYAGVEGELPFEYWDHEVDLFVDLDTDGTIEPPRIATLDYSDGAPVAYVGSYVTLDELALRNMRTIEGW